MSALKPTFRHNRTVLHEMDSKMYDHMTMHTTKAGSSRKPEAFMHLIRIKIHNFHSYIFWMALKYFFLNCYPLIRSLNYT